MSYYNNKKSVGRIIANILCGVLCVAAVAGAGTALYMGGKNNGWFDKQVEEEQPNIPDEEQPDTSTAGIGGMVMPEKVITSNVRLMSAAIAAEDYEDYGIMPTAESAQTVTAVITPANATNQKVDYTVEWANASSSWATGKTVTDYVTVAQSTDGSLTATVTCLQAFGEKINVRVTSRDNANATATLPVDYVKRVNNVVLALKYDTGTSGFQSNGGSYGFGSNNTYRFDPTTTYSAGTITPNVSFGNMTVRFTDEGLTQYKLTSYYKGTYNSDISVGNTFSASALEYSDLFNCSASVFVQSITDNRPTVTPTFLEFSCSYTASYEGVGTISSGTVSFKSYPDVSALKVPVEGVNFGDNSGLIF